MIETWIALNKVGATVPVYHDPAYPTEAVLERGIYAALGLNSGIGIVSVCSPLASATNGAALRVDGGVVRSIV